MEANSAKGNEQCPWRAQQKANEQTSTRGKQGVQGPSSQESGDLGHWDKPAYARTQTA